MEHENLEENGFYLYLDFGGTLLKEALEKEAHLRIANLHKEHPLIQFNERVFEGTFDMAMGTNMFFEITDSRPEFDVFGREQIIHLDYFAKQTKNLLLVPVKIKPKKPDIEEEQLKIQYNLNWDYETLMKKWDDGTLDLKYLLKDPKTLRTPSKLDKSEQDELVEDEIRNLELPPENTETNSSGNDDNSLKDLEEDYQKLQLLVRKPVKRKVVEEVVEDPDDKYKESYELHNLGKQVLQPSLAFTTENFMDINDSSLFKCIDVERCVLYGMLEPAALVKKVLSEQEKKSVLTLQNFDNLSLTARHYVIKNIISNLSNQIENIPSEKLQEKDEFGRSPLETINIYKRLEDTLFERISEGRQPDSEKLENIECI